MDPENHFTDEEIKAALNKAMLLEHNPISQTNNLSTG
jgi:hypothetical protein